MPDKLKYIVLLLVCIWAQTALAQSPINPNYPPNPGQQQRKPNFNDTTTAKNETPDQQLDSLRKKLEKRKDSVIFSAKFIRVTNERLLKDSTQLFRLDTSLVNFENYSPLNQIRNPKISLGNLGLSARDLLYEPSQTIGFDVGLHALDPYVLNPQDINYYRARVPYTQANFVLGGRTEQMLKIIHTQNVNPQLNVGFNVNFNGSQGFYSNNGILGQNVSDVNVGGFAWYESKNKRYNLLGNVIYNNLKAPETGSILNDSIYKTGSIDKTSELVRLPNTWENWKGGRDLPEAVLLYWQD